VNWNSTTIVSLLATLAIGALVTLQPPVNSELGKRTSDLGAAFISVSVTFLILGVILVVFGDPGSLAKVREVPAIYLSGGVYGAAFVAVSLVTVRHLGAGTTIALLVSSQLVVAALLDQFGVLGLDQLSLTPLRMAGIATLILGTVLVTVR
jgi:transporter family-2 protein